MLTKHVSKVLQRYCRNKAIKIIKTKFPTDPTKWRFFLEGFPTPYKSLKIPPVGNWIPCEWHWQHSTFAQFATLDGFNQSQGVLVKVHQFSAEVCGLCFS